MNTRKIFNLVMALIFVFSILGMPRSATAQGPNPNIWVHPDDDFVEGYGWPADVMVNVSVDDPATQTNPDLTRSVITGTSKADYFILELGDTFDIRPGFVVGATYGTTTKETIVTNLLITSVDALADRVSGTADPDVNLQAVIWGTNYIQIDIQADSNGNWTADFAGLHDFQSGECGGVQEFDSDGDSTSDEWCLGKPQFMLNIYNDSSWGGLTAWNWPLGSQVTLTVDDPNTPEDPDYTEVQTMEEGSSEYHFTRAEYDAQGGGFIGHPGFTITLSDGIQEKSMVVHLLVITGYDLANDTVTGVSDPFLRFLLPIEHADGSEYVEPTVVADNEGNWLLDLGGTFDLRPGDGFEPQYYDDDRDIVVLRDWSVPIDIDRDGITDVLDPCPDDATDTCNQAGSTAGVIGVDGGVLATENGEVALNVPAGSLGYDVTLSITDVGSGYELASDQGQMTVVHSYSIQPNGTQFDPPASITFRWDDADNNGIVDSTTIQEANLLLIKDGMVITPACAVNPDCDMVANELTVEVTSLSLFALAVPLDHPQLTALSPAKVWVGLKNSDDVGTKFDLLAEVYQYNMLVGSGELDKVNGGSSGFNNAKLNTIPLTLFAPVDWLEDSALSIKLYVRNTCYGNTHNSGTARLWYNDASANSQFGAAIDDTSQDYFLRDGFTLSTTPGSGPKKTIDVAAGRPCSPFKLFGTWSIVP